MRLSIIAFKPSIQPLFAAAMIIEYSPLARSAKVGAVSTRREIAGFGTAYL
jgi:hypothetical protein